VQGASVIPHTQRVAACARVCVCERACVRIRGQDQRHTGEPRNVLFTPETHPYLRGKTRKELESHWRARVDNTAPLHQRRDLQAEVLDVDVCGAHVADEDCASRHGNGCAGGKHGRIEPGTTVLQKVARREGQSVGECMSTRQELTARS
jgi:hypothetical protein